MDQPSRARPTRLLADDTPHFLYDPSFDGPQAERTYGPVTDPAEDAAASFLADELTRDLARRMHYAAHRHAAAGTSGEARRWRRRYYALRDRIVLGNRKLVYRIARRWTDVANGPDDLIGECYIVLIRAVRVYNPWLGIRFSTYACTCLMRALHRLTQRWRGGVLARCVPLDLLGETAEPDDDMYDEAADTFQGVGRYLRDDHPLLSAREKAILARRFRLGPGDAPQTLEQVGQDLGLSKERVRQVQEAALGKLRQALRDCAETPQLCAAR